MCEIIERNRQEAAAEGETRGMLKALLSMLKKGRITEADAAEDAGMSVSDFRKAVAALG